VLLVGVVEAGSKRSEIAEADLLPNAMPSRADGQQAEGGTGAKHGRCSANRIARAQSSSALLDVWPTLAGGQQSCCLNRAEAVLSIPRPI
jgi:hypothetical protein